MTAHLFPSLFYLYKTKEQHQQQQQNNTMTRYSRAAAALYLLLESASVIVSATRSLRRRVVTTVSEALQVHQDYESPGVETRIVDGEEAAYGEFPWFSSSANNILCGASLIHKQFLLTAAHCYEPGGFLPGSPVYVGAYKRGSGAVIRTVVEAVLHPEFDKEHDANDYMLLLLNAPVETITPIELNTDDTVPADGETVTAIGFGLTSEDGELPMTLRFVHLIAIGHLPCAMSYLWVNPVTQSNMLCAGSANDGQEDSCNGDSGGPLISADGKLVGIVSYGMGCGRNNSASVYARVSGGMSFINAGICSLATVDRPDSCPELDDVPPANDTTTYLNHLSL
jgi:trypsin